MSKGAASPPLGRGSQPNKVYFSLFFPGICKANPRKKKRKIKLFSSNHASSVVRQPQAYLGGLEYKNNVLELIHFPNGRIDKTGAVDTFQYYLTDHLGNIVVLFQDTDGDGAIALEEETNGAMDEVIQRNYYYSFGLRVDSPDFQIGDEPENNYLYNGKELNEELDLNWLAYGFRWYDPAVGRFPSVDPLADQFAWVSPFNYAENDPVQYVDLWGLQQGSKPEFMPIEKPSHLITRTP
jgi:RHS repeat-associated protein